MSDERVVLVTVPNREEGERIAEIVVGEQLAACVNVVGPIRSIYRWEGAICRDEEFLLIIKTIQERYPDLERRILATHPYQTPEVIALPIVAGADAYLSWLRES
jgi:periplasmic divalent cation tolerance protein